jgi:hypothetical protein
MTFLMTSLMTSLMASLMASLIRYRGLEHPGSAQLAAAVEAYSRGVSLSGLSKTVGLPGLRIGWLASRDAAFMVRGGVSATDCLPPSERLADGLPPSERLADGLPHQSALLMASLIRAPC